MHFFSVPIYIAEGFVEFQSFPGKLRSKKNWRLEVLDVKGASRKCYRETSDQNT